MFPTESWQPTRQKSMPFLSYFIQRSDCAVENALSLQVLVQTMRALLLLQKLLKITVGDGTYQGQQRFWYDLSQM